MRSASGHMDYVFRRACRDLLLWKGLSVPRGATIVKPQGIKERSVSVDDRLALLRTMVCRSAVLRDLGRTEKSGPLVGMLTEGLRGLFPVQRGACKRLSLGQSCDTHSRYGG